VTALDWPVGLRQIDAAAIFNRMTPIYPQAARRKAILLDGERSLPALLHQSSAHQGGHGVQKPVPFPMSIYDNVAYALRHYESLSRSQMDQRVEEALTSAALWTEVKDKLAHSALGLSGGQQQRLCVARAVASSPRSCC